ncbi:MAG: aminoacyl-tRNA hydrolase, partial [Verrucomicrobia bacterium]
KVSVGGSSGGHNGVEDIISCCGENFVRFRVGIGHKEHGEMELKDHVLGKFTENEKTVLTSHFPQYIKDLKYLILNGPVQAMNVINQKKQDSQ